MTIQRGSGIGLKVSLEYLANDGIWKDMKKSPGGPDIFSENGGNNWLGQRPENTVILIISNPNLVTESLKLRTR
jgi:hypothetical protein